MMRATTIVRKPPILITWGYVLEMPGRPARKRQIDVMKALGLDTTSKGTVWGDKLERAKRYAGAGQEQLTERNVLLNGVLAGDRVVVADPMCLGVSPGDARWFIEQVQSKRASIIVNGDLYSVAPNGSADDVVAEFARRLNVFNAGKSRSKS